MCFDVLFFELVKLVCDYRSLSHTFLLGGAWVSGGVKIGFHVAQVVADDLEHVILLPLMSQS